MTGRRSLWAVAAPPYLSGGVGLASGARWWARWLLAGASDQQSTARRPAEERPNGARAHATQLDTEYEAFIREHQRAILNYLWRVTGDEQSAYDLTQEVFVRAWRHFATVRAYDNPRAWLFRVATNLALTARRGMRTLTSMEQLGAEREPASSDPAWRVAERDLVRRALDGLPPQRRAALTLREVYGLSCAEVALALGISDAAARMTLSRARDQFRERYLREGSDEHGA